MRDWFYDNYSNIRLVVRSLITIVLFVATPFLWLQHTVFGVWSLMGGIWSLTKLIPILYEKYEEYDIAKWRKASLERNQNEDEKEDEKSQ